MADANDNGRGTVQKIWDALVDPDHGLAIKVAVLGERTANIEKSVTELQADVKLLNDAKQRRTGRRALARGLWAGALAIAMLATAILGLVFST